MEKRYDFIASLGEDCACAKILSKLFIRREAGPFDWICGIPFSRRMSLILRDFPNFLNEKYLKKEKGKHPDKNYDLYVHQMYGTRFLHDFPRNIDLSKSLPAIQKKYNRRISRFQSHLRKEKVLLVFVSKTPYDKSLLIESMKALNKGNNTGKVSLLYLEHNPCLTMTETIEKTLEENLYYVQLNNSPTKPNSPWQGNVPLLSNLMCQYCLGISYEEYLSKMNSLKSRISLALVLFLSCFIPLPKFRRKIRRYLIGQVVDYYID